MVFSLPLIGQHFTDSSLAYSLRPGYRLCGDNALPTTRYAMKRGKAVLERSKVVQRYHIARWLEYKRVVFIVQILRMFSLDDPA